MRTAHAAWIFRAACAFALTAAACVRDASPPRAPVVAFHTDQGEATFGAVDVYPVNASALAALQRANPETADWQRAFGVFTGDTTNLPMFGEYTVLHDTLRFTPRFPPVPGNVYVAWFNGAALAELARRRTLLYVSAYGSWTFLADTTPGSTTVVAAYPSADVLPQNLLRIYLYFSGPMSRGESFRRVRLYDDADSLVENAFFTAGDAVELWDADYTRLTLLFDPGRIKRDLRPREEAGLPLQQGRAYRLVVDSVWVDGRGKRLARSFEKRFRVGPLDRSLPRADAWTVHAPRAGTREPLELRFPEMLDYALLLRMIEVRSPTGDRIQGEISITQNETRWTFTPAAAWADGTHTIEVDADLEDVAGNSLRKLFDVAPGDTGARGVTTDIVRLPFRPRSG